MEVDYIEQMLKPTIQQEATIAQVVYVQKEVTVVQVAEVQEVIAVQVVEAQEAIAVQVAEVQEVITVQIVEVIAQIVILLHRTITDRKQKLRYPQMSMKEKLLKLLMRRELRMDYPH